MNGRSKQTTRQRDAHAVLIERWLDEVLADPAITRMDFSVAWALSVHFNRMTLSAWASVDEYARRCHTDRRTVQRSLRRLESAGHLAATKGGGRKLTTHYRPVMKNSGADAAVSSTENSGADAAVSAAKRAAGQPQKGGSPAPNTPQNSGAGAAQPLKEKKPLKTSDSRAGAREGENTPPDLDEAFEEFLRQWHPDKRSGKQAAARRLFKKIVRSGRASAAQLLAGAMRYAAACEGRELRHIATPINFLRAERWDEQFAPPARARPPQAMSVVEIAEAMARAAEEAERERRAAAERQRRR